MNKPTRPSGSRNPGPQARALPQGVPADRIALLQTFVRIVEAGSMSAAAPLLGATQPTVSRRLRALEDSLGVQLLQRSTHAMRLTLEGERCYERARTLLADWSAFEAEVGTGGAEPEGLLRVAVPHAFGQDKFVAPLAEFLRAYPRVSVEWLLIDDVSDALSRGIDCAIQVGDPTDLDVVAVRLAAVDRILVAAPSILPRKRPSDPDGLATLPWLALRTYYRNELVLTHGATGEVRRLPLRPRVSTDSLYALRSACLAGLGACAASAWMVADDIARGKLVQLAPHWRPAPLPAWISYPHGQHYPSRLLLFVAAMREAVPRIVGSDGRGG
ncbi:LysR family transcriptional regulator [Caenimonas aquaedulcis]|uniref:LysR family transcriptional regulator n=1 Tax=Caenimonas aquaedulcis TaxID=2793270 RepID=A0A931MJ74_9BURK|nr:LysR family transcriptional regulator [Caenimonas aquaedulcis]MBG9390483.1 LysR family transcriptional regulator [Caenimonas aquaedulcis]